MGQVVTLPEIKLKTELDYSQFEILSTEALRLIRSRRSCLKNDKHCEIIQAEVEGLSELTTATVNGRLSTSRR
jgi:hypothetical protein